MSSNLDVAIAVNPHANSELIIKELCKDQVCFWQSRRNRNPDILILDPNLLQTQSLLARTSLVGIQFRRTIESSSLEVVAELVAKGVGCGILPERVLRSLNPEKVERLPGTPHLVDRICLVYKRDFRKLKMGQAFLQHFPKGLP